jgi:hypothetical protein
MPVHLKKTSAIDLVTPLAKLLREIKHLTHFILTACFGYGGVQPCSATHVVDKVLLPSQPSQPSDTHHIVDCFQLLEA